MKKKFFLILTAAMMTASLLTGCGSSYPGKGIDSFATAESYTADAYYDNGVDYSKYDKFLTADGELVDYSYDFSASGNVEEKATALKIYEDIEDYLSDRDGYLENVNNTFNYFDDSYYSGYYSRRMIDYIAYGNLSFTVQIENENADDIVDMLETFCNDNGFVITTMNQYITNYESYEVVDEYDDDYGYYYPEIREKDLEKNLKYTDIQVNISYGIERGFLSKAGLKISSIFQDIFDQFEELIYVVISMFVVSFIIIFSVNIGIGIIKKSSYKRRKKHPEWYQPKEIVLHSADTDNKEKNTNN